MVRVAAEHGVGAAGAPVTVRNNVVDVEIFSVHLAWPGLLTYHSLHCSPSPHTPYWPWLPPQTPPGPFLQTRPPQGVITQPCSQDPGSAHLRDPRSHRALRPGRPSTEVSSEVIRTASNKMNLVCGNMMDGLISNLITGSELSDN